MKISDRLWEIALENYILEHSDSDSAVLRDIFLRANRELIAPRMMSGSIQGKLLAFVIEISGAKRVLELGTFAGYATISMAEALPEGGRITTIEVNRDLQPFIEKSFEQSGVQDKIELLWGDAITLFPTLDLSSYDLVYIDANKKSYPEYYRLLIEALPVGAIILADNTLWDGKVYDPSMQDAHTIAIREFNDMVMNDKRVRKVLLPLRDGLTLIRKIQ